MSDAPLSGILMRRLIIRPEQAEIKRLGIVQILIALLGKFGDGELGFDKRGIVH